MEVRQRVATGHFNNPKMYAIFPSLFSPKISLLGDGARFSARGAPEGSPPVARKTIVSLWLDSGAVLRCSAQSATRIPKCARKDNSCLHSSPRSTIPERELPHNLQQKAHILHFFAKT
jgi:hypothetical protein